MRTFGGASRLVQVQQLLMAMMTQAPLIVAVFVLLRRCSTLQHP